MIIDPAASVLENVAHKQIDILSICSGAIQQSFKRIAATVRGSGQLEPVNQTLPNNAVLSL